jgi:hypothetical protein
MVVLFSVFLFSGVFGFVSKGKSLSANGFANTFIGFVVGELFHDNAP